MLECLDFVGRRARLELILPRAQLFQEGVESLQQWLMTVEQDLAELRNAERVMLHLSEATERAKVWFVVIQRMIQLHVHSKYVLCYLNTETNIDRCHFSGCCRRDQSQNC